MADRSRVIVIDEGRLALIKREREGRTYYVFPGGGVEEGESLAEAAVREAREELGLDVQLGPQVAVDRFGDRRAYYYLASVAGGLFGTGDGPEYHSDGSRGTFTPVWVSLRDLPMLDVRPRRIAQAVTYGRLDPNAPLIIGYE